MVYGATVGALEQAADFIPDALENHHAQTLRRPVLAQKRLEFGQIGFAYGAVQRLQDSVFGDVAFLGRVLGVLCALDALDQIVDLARIIAAGFGVILADLFEIVRCAHGPERLTRPHGFQDRLLFPSRRGRQGGESSRRLCRGRRLDGSGARVVRRMRMIGGRAAGVAMVTRRPIPLNMPPTNPPTNPPANPPKASPA